jgi:hypothetical protein
LIGHPNEKSYPWAILRDGGSARIARAEFGSRNVPIFKLTSIENCTVYVEQNRSCLDIDCGQDNG